MNSESAIEESSSDYDQLILQIDAVCLKFESDWSPESAVIQMDAILAGFGSERLKPRLFRELVATDCELRTRRQIELTPGIFAESFPQYSDEVEAAVDLWNQSEIEYRRETHRIGFDALPQRIGEYEIVRELGRGGSSVVLEAIQPELDRRVALKTFILNPVRALEQRQRFALEVKAASSLEHEHIVSVYHSGENDGLLYYAMQYVDGDNFHNIIRHDAEAREGQQDGSSGFLKPRRCAQAIAQATTALDYAHRQGVLHRDIKPSNLLLDKSGDVRLTDFGLAQLAGSDSQLTATGNVVGSLRYLPPEAFDGIRDERSDVYGLGLTLYEMLTLQPAFPDKDRSRLVPRIQEFDVRAPRQIDDSIPPDLETITMRAMAPDPADRYASARDFGDDLKRFLAGKPIYARAVTPVERALKWLRRNPGVAALSALVGMILLLGIPALLLMWQGWELDRVRASRELAEVKFREARAAAEAERERARAEGAAAARADAEYTMLINFAQQSIEAGNYAAASQRMTQYFDELKRSQLHDEGALDRLGWEWEYLLRLLNQARVTVKEDASSISRLRMSPNEKQLLVVGQRVNAQVLYGGVVKLRDASFGDLIKTIADCDEIFSDAAFSPDGSTLATISLHQKELGFNGWLRVWDVESGEELCSRKLVDDFPEKLLLSSGIKRKLPQIEFDASGETLITSAPIVAFDVQTLEPEWKQDGERFYLLGADEVVIFTGRHARRHDVKTGKPLAKSTQTVSPPTDFCLGPNKAQSLQAVQVRTNRSLCELRDKDLKASGKFHIPRSYWTSFTPDCKSMIRSELGGDMVIQALENGAAAERRLIGHHSPVHLGVFNRAGDRLITGSRNGTIKIWEFNRTNAQKMTMDIPNVSGQPVESLTFNGAGDRIHFASSSFYNRELCGSVQVDGTGLQQCQLETTNFIHWPRNDIGYSHDGSLLAAPAREAKRLEPKRKLVQASSSGRINIWSTDTNEILQTIELGSGGFVTGAAFSQNKQWLAIARRSYSDQGFQSSIAVAPVGASSDTPIRWLSVEQEISCLQFIRNDRWLAMSEDSGGVIFLPIDGDGEAQRIADPLSLNQPSSTTVDVDSTETLVAVSSLHGQSVRVFDIATRSLKYETSVARGPCSVCFSPDGRRLAVVGQDSIAHLLDSKSGHILLTLDGRSDTREASPGTSIKVVFSQDGSRIATQGLNGRITVWDSLSH